MKKICRAASLVFFACEVFVQAEFTNANLKAYFEAETKKIETQSLAEIKTKADWLAKRGLYRERLFEMLGLDPAPEKTPLKAAVTGRIEEDDFVVENIHFQSSPKFYVTGNLYRPKKQEGKAPAILYVCGHGGVKKNGVIYGNKVHYQHHGSWFARHGYVCFIIDSVQLGELEGIHHGTYREKMWWWNNKGYSSAATEAWNGMRALDYLESRPEVDAERIGVTGRSGGGAYSWWIAALDDRIKVAVPVAGITSLRNHVVDGCVEGHCDCMYMVNTYRWDFAQVAALVAPRPLLISNTDKDRIFPLDGVYDVHHKTRRIYKLLGKEKNLGLNITEGPHKDTQPLRMSAFHWFNRFLKGEKTPALIDKPAVKFFEPEQLKVFKTLPEDAINGNVFENFTSRKKTHDLLKTIKEKCFGGWPEKSEPLNVELVEKHGADLMQVRAFRFDGQYPFRHTLIFAHLKAGTLKEVELMIGNRDGNLIEGKVVAGMMPRGMDTTAWSSDERTHTQIRRRFMLLGQTLDGMRVYDVRRAIQAVGAIKEYKDLPITLKGEGVMAGIALYASLFEPAVKKLVLKDLPKDHRNGPIFLNIDRFAGIQDVLKLAAEKIEVVQE